jgi:outer membrane protein assembly factor BamB
MRKTLCAGVAFAAVWALLSCRVARPAPGIRLEPPGFPLVRTAVIAVDGGINPPLRFWEHAVYFTRSDGSVCAVDASERRALWTFGAENPVAVPPEPAEGGLLVLDEKNVLYVLDPETGALRFKTPLGEAGDERPTTAVRGTADRIYYGTRGGLLIARQASASAAKVWEHRAGSPARSGPVFAGSLILFGLDDGRLVALRSDGRPAWSFQGRGSPSVETAVGQGRVYFATLDRYIYALDSVSGKKKWDFRLGAPASNIVASGSGRLFVTASSGVLYELSERAGDIRWWRPLPSRVLFPPVAAGSSVLGSYPGPDIAGFDIKTGDVAGSFLAEGDLLSGPCRVGSALAFVEKGPSDAKDRLVFVERDVELLVSAAPPPPRTERRPVELSATAVGFDDPKFEFFVVEGVVRVRCQGPSRKSSWVWIPSAPGELTVVVRASDKDKSREAIVTCVIEKAGDKE